MKTVLRSCALVAFAALALHGTGIAVAGADAPKAGGPCAGCPQAAAGNPAGPPMMDGMKDHLAGMKSAVAALRESEAKLSGIDDPKAFRAAVIDHLKKIDDLQASHLVHMESMMGRMPGGMQGMDRGRGPDCGCGDCRCDHRRCDDRPCRGEHRGRCGCCGDCGHAR